MNVWHGIIVRLELVKLVKFTFWEASQKKYVYAVGESCH